MKTQSPMSLFSMVLLGMNTIIGSGIFLLPGQVTALIGNWSLAVYLFSALVILSIAWCFSKCAALFTRNGGAYLYAKQAFGNFVGFEIGMMRWAVGIIAWASLAVAFATALGSIWPIALQEPYRTGIILSLVAFLGVINLFNWQAMTLLNNVITIAKLVPLLFFVGVGIFYIKKSNFIPLQLPEFETDSFGAAALIVFYAFGGFEALVVAAGEMKNPKKNLPIAVMSAISLCTLLYFLIQLIAVGTLGLSLAESVSPISDVAEMLFGSSGKIMITFAMLISIAGVNLAAAFIVPKSGAALAEDGLIPAFIAQKNRFGTPTFAVLITILATSLIAMSGSFVQLVTISAISRFAQYITTCLAVFVFYKESFTLKKPITQALPMLVPLFALTGLGWLMLQTPWYQLAYGFAALVLSLPIYFLMQNKETSLAADVV